MDGEEVNISTIKKRKIAQALIQRLDDATDRKWTYNDETLIDAFLEFHQSVSTTGYEKVIPADVNELIGKIDEIVTRFYSNSGDYFKPASLYSPKELDLNANEIGELRAELSTLMYYYSKRVLKALSLSKSQVEVKKDKAKGLAYKKAFQEKRDSGESVSFSDNYAGKIYKMDPEYIKEIQAAEEDAQDYWDALNQLEMAREVLNAMSPKRNS